jgi:hypothetical protein
MKKLIIAVILAQFWITATAQVLGTWRDSEVAKCDITIKKEGAVAKVSQSNCQYSYLEGTENYKLFGSNGFKPGPLKIGDRTLKLSWYYKIASSGDLEVRDPEGVIRVIPSIAPKTEKQQALADKSRGVSVGMSSAQVLASSWGKPRKVNRTTTANGVKEQWVYGGGYLYFFNGVLTGIQN